MDSTFKKANKYGREIEWKIEKARKIRLWGERNERKFAREKERAGKE